ncbi:MAG: phage integrase [Modestobacter sp.]|nr:phage integrase [Modestobacter sp.]
MWVEAAAASWSGSSTIELDNATIRRVHATAMSALATAVKRRKIAANPGEHVELPSGRTECALVWTEHRIEA